MEYDMFKKSLFALFMLLPGMAAATPISLLPLGQPDIQVTPVSVSYTATSNEFMVGMTPFGPVTGESLVVAGDGSLLAAENLAISIDVRIDDVGGMPMALSGGSGLMISGTIFDDNSIGGGTLASGTLLTGDLLGAALDGSIVELSWALTGGDYIGAFGIGDAFAMTFVNLASLSPFSGFGSDFRSSPNDFTISTDTQAAVVPVPAGLPLLLTAIGAFAYLRGRGARRSSV
jgi:hypothetical protein